MSILDTFSHKLAKREGRYVASDTVGDVPPSLMSVSSIEYDCKRHSKLGNKRCLGCGRTRNEIALDGNK